VGFREHRKDRSQVYGDCFSGTSVVAMVLLSFHDTVCPQRLSDLPEQWAVDRVDPSYLIILEACPSLLPATTLVLGAEEGCVTAAWF
jgi:hypothetical protein